MAEKVRSSKRSGEGDGVLGALPASRPNRLGRRARGDATTTATKPRPKAGANGKAAAPKAKAAASKAKAAAERKTAPAEKPTPILRAARPPAEEKPRRPKAVSAGSHALTEPTVKANERREPTREERPPSGAELAATVVQAAGELAQIGITVGGQILKRAVGRLPKP